MKLRFGLRRHTAWTQITLLAVAWSASLVSISPSRSAWAGGGLSLSASLRGEKSPLLRSASRAPAANRNDCDSPLLGLPRLAARPSLEIPQENRAQALVIAAESGVRISPTTEFTDYHDLINSVYAAIHTSAGDALERADRFAQFGMKLDPLVERAPKDVRQHVWWLVGWGISDMELFDPSEYKVTTDKHVVSRYAQLKSAFPTEDNPAAVVHFQDYARYTKSFVDGNGAYQKHMEGRNTYGGTERTVNGVTVRVDTNGRTVMESGGILSFPAYRDIVAFNMWPLYIKHDMHHIHFAYGHAKGVSLVFRSARSRNHHRFVMMGGMYEGVDTVQYTHESGMAKYFSEVMQMGLEDSLLYLAKAPRAEIDRIIRDSGIDIASFESQLDGYVPSVTAEYRGNGTTGQSLDQELLEFIATSFSATQNTDTKPYTNYHRSSPDHGGSTWDKDFAHYGSMQNMPLPTDSNGASTIPAAGPYNSGTIPRVNPSGSYNLNGLRNHVRGAINRLFGT